jgi:uncharacterized protein YutD
VTNKITSILEMLGDGRWHMLEEIREKLKIDDAQLRQITDFLNKYDFIVKDGAGKKVKLDRIVQEFLAETATA